MKPFDKELVSGSILRSVWKLAWPSVLLNLINGSQGIIAQIIVGRHLGYAANAAISASWQMYLVLFVFLASLFQGMNVIVAQYAGMRNREALSDVAYQTFLTSILLLLFVAAPIGYLLSPHLLDLVRAAPEVQTHGLPYLRLLFTCSTPLFLMILVTSAFQASGDPKTPLLLGLLTATLNISLSALLITGIGPAPKMGAAGAALGSCLAPIPAILIAIAQIIRGKTILQLPKRLSLIPDLRIVRAVAKVGLPTGIQTVTLNIGGVILLRKVGSLPNSAAAQAAYGICYTQLFMIITWTAFGLRAAASALTGQNLGAGTPERARRCVH
ncbi:MAG TPA: MATE family efflux transporter, partial [Candidatus Hydrogenedentes bacterium]|nr:MATE family efflux transporter [Candidatus Hydrogenedentota bacterium]